MNLKHTGTYFVTEIQSKRKCDAGHAPTAIHTRLLFSLGLDGSLTFVNPAKSFSICQLVRTNKCIKNFKQSHYHEVGISLSRFE